MTKLEQLFKVAKTNALYAIVGKDADGKICLLSAGGIITDVPAAWFENELNAKLEVGSKVDVTVGEDGVLVYADALEPAPKVAKTAGSTPFGTDKKDALER